MAIKFETELYPPIKDFFTGRGFEVKAEIRGCDLVAYREDHPEPTIVEMKKTFTLPLLLQGIDRQRTGSNVWLAVERNRSKKGAHNQRFNDLSALCRRLNIGFLTVTFYKTKIPVIDVWCEPSIAAVTPKSTQIDVVHAAESEQSYQTTAGGRRKAGATRIMKEFNARSGDYNIGGSSKRKLVTAYRERSIQCALALRCHGPSSPRQVRDWTNCPTAGALLRSNYYGWFSRISKGVYKLSPSGFAALKQFNDVTTVWMENFPWANQQLSTEGN